MKKILLICLLYLPYASANIIHEAIKQNASLDDIFYLYQSSYLNEQNEDGNTPLHLAIIYGLEDIAYFLIDNGANLLINNNTGRNPRDIAANHHATKIINKCIDDKQQRTNFHFIEACKEKNIEKTKNALINGANINYIDTHNKTALNYACEYSYKNANEYKPTHAFIHFLIQHGAYYIHGTISPIESLFISTSNEYFFCCDGIDILNTIIDHNNYNNQLYTINNLQELNPLYICYALIYGFRFNIGALYNYYTDNTTPEFIIKHFITQENPQLFQYLIKTLYDEDKWKDFFKHASIVNKKNETALLLTFIKPHTKKHIQQFAKKALQKISHHKYATYNTLIHAALFTRKLYKLQQSQKYTNLTIQHKK